MHDVLFVSHDFPPHGGAGVQRSVKFCKYLPEFGYKPLVLTGASEDVSSLHDDSHWKDLEDTKIFRCRGYERYLVEMPRRWKLRGVPWLLLCPDANVLAWVPRAARAALDVARQNPVRLIYTTGPPFSSALLGLRLKKALGVPWVVDYRDLWTNCVWSIWPTKLHHWFETRQEGRVLDAADAVVVVTPTMKEILARKFPQCADKIHVVCNGFDREDMPSIPDSAGTPNRNGTPNRDQLRIGYAGSLMNHDRRLYGASLGPIAKFLFVRNMLVDFSTHSPFYLLHAVRALLDERPELEGKVTLSFAGLFREKNAKLVRELGLANTVTIKGYLSHADCVRHLLDSDALFFPVLSPADGHRSYVYSGKVFEYLATNKPILAAVPEGDARDLIARARAGWCVDPRDVGAIKSLLGDLVDKKMAGTLNTNPDQQYILQFERRELTRQLAELFDSLLS